MSEKKIDILITTDSVCDLPADLIRELPIELMYYYVVTEEGRFVDTLEIGTEGLLSYMRGDAGKVARAESPASEDYRRFFVEKLTEANQILHISTGKGVSEGYERALEASRRISRVTVFDSGHISSGYGLVVLKAARMSLEGRGLEQIVSELKDLSHEVTSTFVVRDTRYFQRSGWISPQLSAVCERLRMRPVLNMHEGSMRGSWAFFGPWKSVIHRYVRKTFAASWSIDTSVLFVAHICETEEELEAIREEIEKYIHFDHIYFQRVSAAVASNVGPGTIGLLFMKKRKKRMQVQEIRKEGIRGIGRAISDKFRETILREEYGIRHRLMNLILLATLIGGTVSMLASLILGAWMSAIVVAGMLVLVHISLHMSLHQRPREAGFLICFVANTVIFPIMFFYSGGTSSGMPIWLALGLIFDCMILSGWQGILIYFFNLAIMVGVIVFAGEHPDLVLPLPEGYKDGDIIQSLFMVSFLLGMIFKYQSFLYEKQKKQLEQREKDILAASSAKDIFLANMSHEIRTPINGIIGMDTMLLRECGDNEQLRMYGKNIQSASQTLLSLVNDILDISKIESGKLELIPMEYELFSVINDCYVMTKARIGDKGLDFHVRLNPAIPQGLYGDEVRLRQIINNILSNAVKYTQEGSVTLEVDMDLVSDATVILIVSVSDTGMGIRKEDLGKLFESFVRVDEARNRNIEGTGLGLNLTKNLVELMGGEISVDSVYNQGSTFTVRIPQAIRSRAPIGDFASRLNEMVRETEETSERFIAPDARVLVVDDVPMNLMVAEGLMRYTRMTVDKADSGAEALSMVTQKMYDLIFLDHLMPVMDGVECFRQMKTMADNPNVETPVIILTANAIIGARQEYMEIGFTDYLSKPIEEEELYRLLRKYLPKEKILPDTAESGKESAGGHPQQAESEIAGGWTTAVSGAGAPGAPQAALSAEPGAQGAPYAPQSSMSAEPGSSGAGTGAPDAPQASMSAEPGAPGAGVPDTAGEGYEFVPAGAAGGSRAAVSDKKTLAERLAGVEGLDVSLGLKYCMNLEDIYAEALKMYMGGEKESALEEFLEKNDFDNYRITVHALKSTSLNIGAKELSEMAKSSEFACKDGDFDKVREQHPALMKRYRSLLEALRRA